MNISQENTIVQRRLEATMNEERDRATNRNFKSFETTFVSSPQSIYLIELRISKFHFTLEKMKDYFQDLEICIQRDMVNPLYIQLTALIFFDPLQL